MSISRRLKARRDVDNADIPDIIERAEKLRLEAERQRNRSQNRSSVEEVRRVGRELSIPDQFVEQAILDLHSEREKKAQQRRQKADSDRRASKERRQLIQRGIRIVGVLVIGIFLLRGIQWLWFSLNFIPESEVQLEQAATQQTVIHEKETIREVVKVVEVPVSITPPSKKSTPKRVQKKQSSKPAPQVVSEPAKTNNPTSSSVTTVAQKPKTEMVKTESVVKEVSHRVEEPPPASDTVQPKEQEAPIEEKTIEEPTKPVPLPKVASSIQGEWVLDSYLLYEKGVEYPMEVPIVYEPLELPKTWRFSKGRYKRVMDKSLSFSAKYEVVSLPKKLQPTVDDAGTWAQVVASNVVSTIPGIRRQNDYFAVLIDGDVLTIWYLGPNAYRKKIPSQAERYVRD